MGNQFYVLIFAAHVMHPLRFPNSGIRAKVFMRKIDFKLHVIRLYCVESFYAFLLRFHSEEEGRPAMANPHAGSATHDQADYKGQLAAVKAPCKCGGWPRPKPLAGAAASMRDRSWAGLVPIGVVPASVGNARGQAAGGGYPL
ncbi:hypothetical protein B296_00004060 [Ensete ventricosum]|uniref:Uncharacterized protein n=1 Tax=Ensete ventricosum TaxID=4639 RepID=A0A426YER9_ENSVE|nr:hypothetical protein B296_00004060 [Ensete ventricosum]